MCVRLLSPVSPALHTVCSLGFRHGFHATNSSKPWLCSLDEDTANLGQREPSFHYHALAQKMQKIIYLKIKAKKKKYKTSVVIVIGYLCS